MARINASHASLLLAIGLMVAPAPALPQSTLTREQALQIQRDCSTVDECIAAMRTETAVNGSAILESKFAEFGEQAVEPLMRVLTEDPDPRMRSYAGRALSRMPSIDERHLPALIAASRQGNPTDHLDEGPGWLAIPIGLVRDNPDALRYLFDLTEIYGSRSRSNAIQPAIERSSQDAWLAEARRRLEAFEPDQGAEYLAFVAGLALYGGDRRPSGYVRPEWLEPVLVRIATDPSVNADARDTAARHLSVFRHPIALETLLRDARLAFAALPEWDGQSRFAQMLDADGKQQWERLSDGHFEGFIDDIRRFGPIGIGAAPLLRPFLARPDLPDSRAAAAWALGEIGDRAAIPDLIAAAQDRDDWLLAYNAAESLGRLRAEDARSTLRELAQDHWSQAVRNNASRALNMIEGGEFARPGAAGDGRGVNDGLGDEDYLYMGHLRFRGDWHGGEAECVPLADEGRLLDQSPVGALRFPRRGAEALGPAGVPADVIPEFPDSVSGALPRGSVTALEPLRRGVLIGTNAGEFIGGLVFVDDRDHQVTLVVDDNVSFLFRHGGRLYALTGLSHMTLSHGEIWEIATEGRTPRATRRIRLPSEAYRVFTTARRDIAFVTSEGTVLLSENGDLRHGGDDATCRRD